MRRLLLFFASVALAACTQDFDVFTPDGGAVDAPGDAPPADASTDAPKTDGGTDGAPTDANSGDGALTFVCGTNGTVSDCSQCAGQPEPCVFCNQQNPSMLAGRCLAANASCFGAQPNGYGFCACNNNASACPEAYEVCRMGFCRTCTDSNNNNGLTCKSGGTCAPFDGGC